MIEKELTPAAMALVQKEDELDKLRRHHEYEAARCTRVRDQIREAIASEMGEADVGVYEGQVVIRKVDTSQFAKARFAKQYPDIWEEVKVPKLTYGVDVEKLKEIDPALYQEFCTRRWYNETSDAT
jgi:hypothetical protein